MYFVLHVFIVCTAPIHIVPSSLLSINFFSCLVVATSVGVLTLSLLPRQPLTRMIGIHHHYGNMVVTYGERDNGIHISVVIFTDMLMYMCIYMRKRIVFLC